MGDIFLTSDLHLLHNKPFLYEPRGFSSIEEHDEAIVERWNSVVKPRDIVYHLGDCILSDLEKGIECMKRLNGEIYLIRGNHDSDNKLNTMAAAGIKFYGGHYAEQIKHGKLIIYLSHYLSLTSNWDSKHFSQHVINFHGHTHQKTNWLYPNNPFMYHVGMDSHDCYPVHIETAIADIRNRWNEIGNLPTPVIPQDTYPYM